jgi:hypothetical protein
MLPTLLPSLLCDSRDDVVLDPDTLELVSLGERFRGSRQEPREATYFMEHLELHSIHLFVGVPGFSVRFNHGCVGRIRDSNSLAALALGFRHVRWHDAETDSLQNFCLLDIIPYHCVRSKQGIGVSMHVDSFNNFEQRHVFCLFVVDAVIYLSQIHIQGDSFK